jgi:simple sugar transport system ATP-binding protein
MIKFKDVFNKLSKNKKNLVLALCSVLALVLLLVSEFASNDSLDSSEKVNSYVSSENYIKEQEEKLKELLEAIAGLQAVTPESSVTFISPKDGTEKELIGKSPRKIRELGVSLSFVPEDRLGMGLVGSMGMTENMMLRYYNNSKSIFAETKSSRDLALRIAEELKVVTPGIDTPVSTLSGGNVQKVLVGREISASPTVLMTAYAVRGLDINTSYTIYHLLNEQKKNGVAVIYVGEDLDVLLELSDRILVLCGGKLNGIVDARTTNKQEIGLLMTNLKKEEK